jgi:hypothetical protein
LQKKNRFSISHFPFFISDLNSSFSLKPSVMGDLSSRGKVSWLVRAGELPRLATSMKNEKWKIFALLFEWLEEAPFGVQLAR